MDYKSLLHTMVRNKASDLHLRVGCVPYYRIHGNLVGAKTKTLTVEDMNIIIQGLLNQWQEKALKQKQEIDAGVGVPGLGRFRLNAFNQRGTPSLAIRHIKSEIPPFHSLNVPDIVLELAMQKRGLILVTGTTGSGKSTLLASMIDHINSHRASNIITIEDPIEFLHRNKKSAVAQREIGQDTSSYTTALRAAMRQDPDVIFMGEIRDEETMLGALTAADTGHLVLSTMHTLNAVETISRAVSFFPAHQHQQVRLLMSSVLQSVISMRLLPRDDKAGMVPATEIMVNHAATEEYLRDAEKTHLIPDIIKSGNQQYGSQSFDQSLEQLYKLDMVSFETAKQYASNPDDFELRVVGGISSTGEENDSSDDLIDRF
ncbi:type IV pilus twitching motility protein PilT [Chitinivibrio alkaliphilus]|uniref:Twitching motility protein n=1 Tax=Chitinivibrio alkaliphilus ACht1 TaxID=1313304 RepID=U7D6J7_9BACT|nr:PilT/PilU family type 4a pilus ATPase [Chitinivibrio alkaliphilus]ERP31558.1 twitching motility protein [Chitinivibrio alkaliphilus ACht1]